MQGERDKEAPPTAGSGKARRSWAEEAEGPLARLVRRWWDRFWREEQTDGPAADGEGGWAMADEEWRPLDPAAVTAGAGPFLPAGLARSWDLVLTARHIPHQLRLTEEGWALLVPPALGARAIAELRLYREENRNWPPLPPPARSLPDNTLGTVSVLLLLAVFHNLIRLRGGPHWPDLETWMARGCADAGRIRAGEWWRAVTALTLHVNALHLAGNLVIGGFFVILLCRRLGAGLGWGLLLLAGTLGNLLNALLQPAGHQAVGASTAIFGALGILAGLNMPHSRRSRHWLLPLAAALALLGMLGSGGKHTDLGAHLFGLAAGVGTGLGTAAWQQRRGPAGRGLQVLSALAAAVTVLGCWLAAFGLLG